MGYSMTWLIIDDNDVEKVINSLGLIKSGEFEEIPESKINFAEMGNGKSILIANEIEFFLFKDSVINSIDAFIVKCQLEEHVMYSKISAHENGKVIYSVSHDAQLGIMNLDFSGNIPSEILDTKNEFFKKQSDSDKNGENGEVDYII